MFLCSDELFVVQKRQRSVGAGESSRIQWGFLLRVSPDGFMIAPPLSARLRRQPNSVACIYLGCMTSACVPVLRWCGGQPDGFAHPQSYSDLFEPVMRIRLIVEGLDFKISALAIQRLRFFEGPVGLQPERAHAKFSCMRFQRFEDAPTDAEAARIVSDQHEIDLADRAIFHFESAAT